LMDATLLKLPDVEDLLVQVGRLRLQQQWPDAAAKAELNQLLGRFQAHLDALHKGMKVAFQHTQSPTLRPRLERSLREYTSALQAVLAWLQHQAAPLGDTQAAEAPSVFRRAWEAAFTLWDESIDELDRLLQARIEGFERRRNLLVALALAALLGVVYLWAGFYASVVGAVASLESASQQMLRGAFPASVLLPTRDELGQVATSFNNVARRLREEWAQAQEESRNASRAEASLRASEARTRLIIDTALDAVLGMDAEGCVIEWNAQAASTFGWTSQEALGRNLAELLIPDNLRGAHARGLKHFLATGEGPVLRQRLEVTALHRAGHTFPVELTISPLRTGAGCTFSAFARDISARKQAELELHNAKEAAEAASRAKSEFLATMSHEIRTPMNGVLGMIGLLLDTPLLEEQREFAQTVHNSAEALLTIINDILDFSKIEAGRMTIEPIPFDLEVAAEEVLELLATRAHEKNLELALRYAPHTPRRVVGDPGRIRQILLNLAGNAIKFTACGYVLVDIQERPTGPGPASSDRHNDSSSVAHITIAVQDTGIGIAEDKMPGLFQKFTQADASTTRQFGGTGLGLAISKQLVELMGGTIEVTSAQGKGSTFSCRLPLPLDTTLPAPRARPADVTGVRVLVVVAHALQRRLYCEQLSAWGMRCSTAESATAALAILRREQTVA
ncbi:MAG TPA: ATP-binding protein, partial [Candidatus Saccharimonadia bacterium]|nr:ATP-binding protein [Candidatus Saccharimonadia bacterium]